MKWCLCNDGLPDRYLLAGDEDAFLDWHWADLSPDLAKKRGPALFASHEDAMRYRARNGVSAFPVVWNGIAHGRLV